MNKKVRTIFTVIGFDLEYLKVIRASTNEDEIIHIPLHILNKKFIDKIIYGLKNWKSGVLFFAKIESIPGFEKVYRITDFEENIEEVETWEEILND